MRDTEFLALRVIGTCSPPDRNPTASRSILRGLMWLFVGVGLMVHLYSMNAIMAHHWSAPRHWFVKTCYLEVSRIWTGEAARRSSCTSPARS